MKQMFFLAVLLSTVLTCTTAQQSSEDVRETAPLVTQPAAELTFDFTRLRGVASNQFAVWVEDAQGRYVKTLYAVRWTANGGWRRRPTSIPVWVEKSGLSEKTQTQVDAVSAATPGTGKLTYTWDGTDSRGAVVPAGDYVIFLEGTLRWANQVLYSAPVSLGQGPATPQVKVEYSGDAGDDRAMIGGVEVRVLR